jgi:ribosomal protein S18 acetylase RimI-like enzyme
MPFDARHHMRQVADLVNDVFAPDLDAGGRSTLQEMRWAALLSPIFGDLLSLFFFDDFISGYVWVDGGRVVGNVNFQSADEIGARWRVSNVAVAPAYRRRGIAKALLEPTLRGIAQRGGDWAILHVRSDNLAARRLYESLGFRDVCQEGIWRRAAPPVRPPDPDPSITLQRLPVGEWATRLELAQAARPQLAHWAEPVNPDAYRTGDDTWLAETLGQALGLYRVERWGLRTGNVLAGAVEIFSGEALSSYRIRFDVRPAARGSLEGALVAQALRSLAPRAPRPIVVEHSGDHAEGVAALEAAGFRAERVLVTMRKAVGSGGAR